jgi:6-phosphogluconolactonase
VTLELEVAASAAGAARHVARLVAERAGQAVASRGRFALALSKVPPELLSSLAAYDMPWPETTVYQVDERVAPAGGRDRNLTALVSSLPQQALNSVRAMPVDDPDLETAAERYAAELPQLDLVHLGVGTDGHTASLVPGDPVLEVDDRLVAVTGKYEGMRRMTLTYPALNAARETVWLVTGSSKRDALARLLARDESIPAARVANPSQLVVADTAAARSL